MVAEAREYPAFVLSKESQYSFEDEYGEELVGSRDQRTENSKMGEMEMCFEKMDDWQGGSEQPETQRGKKYRKYPKDEGSVVSEAKSVQLDSSRNKRNEDVEGLNNETSHSGSMWQH